MYTCTYNSVDCELEFLKLNKFVGNKPICDSCFGALTGVKHILTEALSNTPKQKESELDTTWGEKA